MSILDQSLGTCREEALIVRFATVQRSGKNPLAQSLGAERIQYVDYDLSAGVSVCNPDGWRQHLESPGVRKSRPREINYKLAIGGNGQGHPVESHNGTPEILSDPARVLE